MSRISHLDKGLLIVLYVVAVISWIVSYFENYIPLGLGVLVAGVFTIVIRGTMLFILHRKCEGKIMLLHALSYFVTCLVLFFFIGAFLEFTGLAVISFG